MVSRQNLAGLLSRMERDGHIAMAPDARDRRSRLVTMTDSGRHVWRVLALPKIHAYYEQVLADFSINDTRACCTISSASSRICESWTWARRPTRSKARPNRRECCCFAGSK